MTKEQIINRTNRIIIDQLQVNASEITPAANLFDDLGGDSLDAVEIVMAIEEEFDIEIPDDDLWAKPCTVGRAYEYLEKRMF